MSSRWGWWLPKKQESEASEKEQEEHTLTTEEEEEYISYDKVSDALNEARYYVEQALDYLAERKKDKIIESIKTANFSLRTALVELGYLGPI